MVCLCLLLHSILTVGDGQEYSRIEDAVAAAHPGDTIEVFPKQAGYGRTAVRATTIGLHIIGMGAAGGIGAAKKRILIDGTGFDYSGVGSTPRAIFQADPGSDGLTLEGFELSGAHNGSYNGAGVRINQASQVTVRDCDIHGNDMGIMSGGTDGNANSASDQMIDHCSIHENGNLSDPGYNHNLYLGGTSAIIQFCDIFGSLTGHNLKSRAHFNLVQYCFVHASSNREMDFVEAWDTSRANSNVVLIGNVIVKSSESSGNRNVIHFGQESGVRIGTIYLINNTILTPFQSPVVLLSTPQGAVRFFDSVIYNDHQSAPTLVGVANGATLASVDGGNNWISTHYDISGTNIDAATRFSQDFLGANPRFLSNYAIPNQNGMPSCSATYLDGNGKSHSALPGYRFMGKGEWMKVGSAGSFKPAFIGAG